MDQNCTSLSDHAQGNSEKENHLLTADVVEDVRTWKRH